MAVELPNKVMQATLTDKSRRAESYLTNDLTIDLERCEGQRYFLNRAKEFGCESIVLFSNTPPVQYTQNGKGFSNQGGVSNLKNDCYDDFAAYMGDVAQYYIDKGYPVTHSHRSTNRNTTGMEDKKEAAGPMTKLPGWPANWMMP